MEPWPDPCALPEMSAHSAPTAQVAPITDLPGCCKWECVCIHINKPTNFLITHRHAPAHKHTNHLHILTKQSSNRPQKRFAPKNVLQRCHKLFTKGIMTSRLKTPTVTYYYIFWFFFALRRVPWHLSKTVDAEFASLLPPELFRGQYLPLQF